MGNYDIPSMLNKVLEATGHEKIFYIGNFQTKLIHFLKYSKNLQQKILQWVEF